MSEFLQKVIPSTNRLEAGFSRSFGAAAKAALLKSSYDTGFVGSFLVSRGNNEIESSGWMKRAGEYLRDEFHAEAEGAKFFTEVAGNYGANGDGENHQNHRFSLETWADSGNQGVKPFTTQQDYGSCVDASLSELLSCILGYRIKVLRKAEVWKTCAAWYAYSLRGYCSDGWNAWGAASAIKKLGVAFRQNYSIGSNSVDLTDDDTNEQIMARTWCRSGPPSWMREFTNTNNPINPNAVVEFDGGKPELKKVFANGGVLHFSGTRQSGGSRPFTPGSVGPHQLTAYGYDDSEEGRKWFRDKCGYTLSDSDFAVHCGQTWGNGWSGECADQYWPPHWGAKTQGSWICSADWFIRNLSLDMVYMPDAFSGFPGSPLPPPLPTIPDVQGVAWVEQQEGSGLFSVRGEFTVPSADGTRVPFIWVPDGAGRYKPIPRLF